MRGDGNVCASDVCPKRGQVVGLLHLVFMLSRGTTLLNLALVMNLQLLAYKYAHTISPTGSRTSTVCVSGEQLHR